MQHNNINKNPIFCLLIVILTMAGCGDAKNPGFTNINDKYLTCMAFDCHSGTQLRIFPPVSGVHLTHLGLGEGASLGCESCHYQYYNNSQHKNGFINGFNWLYNAKTSGTIVFFGTDLPGVTWDSSTGICGSTPAGCHGGNSPNWYSGGGG
jgi:hypothetical protein